MPHTKKNENKISKDLAREICLNTAKSVKGVYSVNDIKIEKSPDNKGLKISMFVDITYGFGIPAVAWDIQNSIKDALKKSADIISDKIDIFIQGVSRTED